MFRPMILAAGLALSGATASALDLSNMTEDEKAAFGAAVREYLLENPELLPEIISVLEERRAAESEASEAAMLVQFEEQIFDDGYSWVGGNPDGDVTVVEFLDYRCGYCKRAHPEVAELIESDGNIRYIVKEFPILGEASVLGSKYAIAVHRVAGDEAYGRVHDTLMRLQGDLNGAALKRVSGELGLDHEAILAEMEAPEIEEIIRENRMLGQALEINGTPSFIFGETFVRGFVELDQMRGIVAAEREEG